MNSKYRADHASGGVFLIGLAMLFLTGWWLPGILFVLGASMIAHTIAEGKPWHSATPALCLIGFGAVFGLPGIVRSFNWSVILAVILIGIGLYMLFGSSKRSHRYDDDKPKNGNDEDEDDEDRMD